MTKRATLTVTSNSRQTNLVFNTILTTMALVLIRNYRLKRKIRFTGKSNHFFVQIVSTDEAENLFRAVGDYLEHRRSQNYFSLCLNKSNTFFVFPISRCVNPSAIKNLFAIMNGLSS